MQKPDAVSLRDALHRLEIEIQILKDSVHSNTQTMNKNSMKISALIFLLEKKGLTTLHDINEIVQAMEMKAKK